MQSRTMLDMLAGALTQRGLAHVRIDGTITSAEERQVWRALSLTCNTAVRWSPRNLFVTHVCQKQMPRRALRHTAP